MVILYERMWRRSAAPGGRKAPGRKQGSVARLYYWAGFTGSRSSRRRPCSLAEAPALHESVIRRIALRKCSTVSLDSALKSRIVVSAGSVKAPPRTRSPRSCDAQACRDAGGLEKFAPAVRYRRQDVDHQELLHAVPHAILRCTHGRSAHRVRRRVSCEKTGRRSRAFVYSGRCAGRCSGARRCTLEICRSVARVTTRSSDCKDDRVVISHGTSK